MLWFVYLNGGYVGTVVAANEGHAYTYALEKFPVWGIVTVSPRRRKRAETGGRSAVRRS